MLDAFGSLRMFSWATFLATRLGIVGRSGCGDVLFTSQARLALDDRPRRELRRELRRPGYLGYGDSLIVPLMSVAVMLVSIFIRPATWFRFATFDEGK